MVLLSSPVCDFGKSLPNIDLKNIDNKLYNREMIVGKNGTLVFFICNHCPYVKAIIKKLVFTVSELKQELLNNNIEVDLPFNTLCLISSKWVRAKLFVNLD